jgi:hypothetical protein
MQRSAVAIRPLAPELVLLFRPAPKRRPTSTEDTQFLKLARYSVGDICISSRKAALKPDNDE